MPHLRKHRRHRPSRSSPFLDLPAEIRNYIYIAALVSPSPIDLCPAKYAHTQVELNADPSLQRRQLLFEQAKTAGMQTARPRWGESRPTKVAFRLQSDLQYVRQHLAVQLLAVCCQTYNEAARYFWGDNVWRFSDDENWEILLRFMLTIGQNARSLIRRLEVLVPGAKRVADVPPRDATWVVKNQPKLRMSKLWEDEWRHDVVWQMWAREKSLRSLSLVIPTGYEADSLYYWLNDVVMEFTAKGLVVIESGGVLYNKDEILQQGWNVLALLNSRILRFSPDYENLVEDVHGEGQLWESDVDCLTGVAQLFEMEDISIHANAGRVHNARNKERGRRLHKFGPCMVRIDDIPCVCWMCQSSYRWNLPARHERTGTKYISLVDIREKELLEWMGDFDL